MASYLGELSSYPELCELWEGAIVNHPDRKPGVRLVTDRPAHKGYPGAIPDARDVLSNLHDAERSYGADRATCPDCRRDYTCPYHRTH